MKHYIASCGMMALSLFLASKAECQNEVSNTAEAQRIEDNSFLIEEAYNQEAGVVQHINTMFYDWKHDTWSYSFTQEWPRLAWPSWLGSMRMTSAPFWYTVAV